MKTPLYDAHVRHGAKMVDFAGWDMPIQYAGTGLLAEHKAVRERAGLFDVSHMGQIDFRGPDAVAVVNRLITNDLEAIPDGKAQYTCITNDDGFILDDAISYRISKDHVLMVVNASNVGKIDAWFRKRASGIAGPVNVSDRWALLALQGPEAPAIGARLIPEAAGMKAFEVRVAGDLVLASTGYTGEPGFEIFVPPARAEALFERICEQGAVPIGLGARDTLRLEMKYSLYGNDIDEFTNPLEAGLGWVTRLDKREGFIGRDALVRVREQGVSRRLVGLHLTERGIARHGYPVLSGSGEAIGTVTSGTQSPSTGEAIAMAYVALPHDAVGTRLQVEIRGRPVACEVVKTPFYKRPQT